MTRNTTGDDHAPRTSRMRETIARGTGAARRLIDRLREITGAHTTALPPESASASRATVAPVTAVKAVEAAAPALTPVPLAAEFVTVTMASVLLAQGRVSEARRVFEQVLARDPHDTAARRGLARIAALAKPGADAPVEPATMLDRAPLPGAYGTTTARAIPVDPSSLVAFWEVPADAPHAAGATRALRIESRGQGGDARVRYVEHVPRRGDYVVRGVPAGASHDVAVGWKIGGGFVPLASAPAIETPRGRPTERPAPLHGTNAGNAGATMREAVPTATAPANGAGAPARADGAPRATGNAHVSSTAPIETTMFDSPSSEAFARRGPFGDEAWSATSTKR